MGTVFRFVDQAAGHDDSEVFVEEYAIDIADFGVSDGFFDLVNGVD